MIHAREGKPGGLPGASSLLQRGAPLNPSDRNTPTSPVPLSLRQGDVLLVEVDGIPDEARAEARSGRIVLAEGEATGHAHAVHDHDARTFTYEGERFLLTRSTAQLVHEEHAPIEVPPGSWRVIIQREYVPSLSSTAQWRRVMD